MRRERKCSCTHPFRKQLGGRTSAPPARSKTPDQNEARA
nr:MAG TPA: hypothetical protein [Caudoviricetes sp.]